MEPSTAGRRHTSEVSAKDANIDEKFLAAVDIVSNLPIDGPVTATTDEKLAFYSLYKQATIGPCNTPRPSFWNLVEKFKWEAWSDLGAMDSNEAKAAYVQRLLKKISEVNKEYDVAATVDRHQPLSIVNMPWLHASSRSSRIHERSRERSRPPTGSDQDWMRGDLYESLVPKFAAIGLHPSNRVFKKNGQSEDEDVEEIAKCPETIGEEEPLSEFENGASDVEYLDAVEEKRHSRSASRSPSGVDGEHRDRSDSIMRQYSARIESELQTISKQIAKLSVATEHRHSTLRDMFRRATFNLLVPGGVPWKTVVIVFVWPFIANVLFRMLRNFIGF